ncbi:PD-(D/E)XK nuclease family protein [Lactobacillus sp. DCY120]|uniref:PD-(D/E)XK nuclease family protein n=1 Tax=Bombilactobacillus apium TaxID=2675299 RepID=A0A850R5E4_9LACO|nr:PD-(D/E)XK nuclease family protein [Bombilactobacillus apium]NVY95822.1 PD-(D/E)XK nuclease family protein [Bombilactobacillus apium]
MTLKFVLGKAQNDHQKIMLHDLKQAQEKQPDTKFIWLVPNHLKFEMEVKVLQSLQTETSVFASNQVQVFSFSRLLWYFLRTHSIYQSPQLTPTLQTMILAQIVREKATDLQLYAGEEQQFGFITILQAQINDLQNQEINVEDLAGWQKEVPLRGDLPLKLVDLQIIYQAYLARIKHQFSDQQALYQNLQDFLKKDPQQAQIQYFISGFSQFTMQEQNLIKTLIQHSAGVEIALQLDPQVTSAESDFFWQRPLRTYTRLRQFAQQAQIPYRTINAPDFRVQKDLVELENFWIKHQTQFQELSPTSLTDPSAIQVWTCPTPQQEIIAVTTYIRQLVATQDYRYRDFLVLARNLGPYQEFLDPYLQNQKISYFIDLQHSMKDHAFKDLLDSLFLLVQNQLQYQDIMRFLRTELVRPEGWDRTTYRQTVDQLDNYILAHALRKSDWLSPKDFASEKAHPREVQKWQQLNQLKQLIQKTYQAITKIMQNNLKGEEACGKLYQLLADLQVFKILKEWEQEAVQVGNLALSQQPEQIVNTFVRLLEEYVQIVGDQPFQANEFQIMLDNGFENAQYSTIPAVLDAIQVSELGMVQNQNHKITIIIGANSTEMPHLNEKNSLLSDDDLKSLQALEPDLQLPASQQELNQAEPYLHDLAFLSSSQRLIFSYAANDAQGENQISPYVQVLQEHFNLPTQFPSSLANNAETEVLATVASPSITTNHLVQIYRQAQDQKQTPPATWQALRELVWQQDPEKFHLTKIWASLTDQNLPESLQPALARQLYGDQLVVSISQLETFYQNPYEYFLRYGLHLHPRTELKITPANRGTFFHSVLDLTFKSLQEKKLSLHDLTAPQLRQLANQLIYQLLDQRAFSMFTSDEEFARRRLTQTVQRALEAIRQQAQAADFYPFKTEVAFGQVGAIHNLEPLEYPINQKQSVVVRGRIDRIDRLTQHPENYFVVDYKSSAHDFQFNRVYAGVDLQMLTYLASLAHDNSLFETPAQPLGGFYFYLQDPTVNFEDLKGQLANYLEFLFKKYRYKGLLVDDGTTGELLEPDLSGQNSAIFQLNKNHKPTSQKVVTSQQLQEMLQYNQELIIQAAQRILQGDLALSPVRLDQQTTALTYSDYRPIMRFDAMLPENNYRLIPKMNRKEFFQHLDSKEDQ